MFYCNLFINNISCCSILLRGFFLHNGRNEWLGNSRSLGKECAPSEEGTSFDAVSAGRKGGVSEETIKNIELCRCWVSEKTLAQLSQSLAVDVCQLFLPVDELSGYENAIAMQIRQGITQSLKLYLDTILQDFSLPGSSLSS